MRRQLIPWRPGTAVVGLAGQIAKGEYFPGQRVNLALLPDDDLIKLVNLVLRKAGFDFQVGQALIDESYCGLFWFGHGGSFV